MFFDAPVGFIFTIDSALTKHSSLDLGLFLQNITLAAHARRLVGYADKHAAVNQSGMTREPLEVFTRRLGFDE